MPVVLFNKPMGVLSQFGDADGRPGLGRWIDCPGVYAAGRLDADSEGLLILTDDGRLQQRITAPTRHLAKTYLAQVEGAITPAACAHLCAGVTLRDGPARAAAARQVPSPAWLWPRDPPIRERRHIPTSWIEIVLTDGRNRQVRRMTAAVGLPTLRLVRASVGPWGLEALLPGEWVKLSVARAWSRLERWERGRGSGERR